MRTTTASRALLPDDVWSRLPRTTGDRRTVGAVLAGLLIAGAAILAANSAGLLVPHFTYEGGSERVNARTRTVLIRAEVSNRSARDWTVSGATVDAAGTAPEIGMAGAFTIPAHARRVITGVARVEHCDALPAAPGEAGYGHSGNLILHVRRLLGAASFTIPSVLDEKMVEMACGA